MKYFKYLLALVVAMLSVNNYAQCYAGAAPTVNKANLTNTETNWMPGQEILFFDGFGTSNLSNGDRGRVTSPYMPLASSFNYGHSFLLGPANLPSGVNPWDNHPILNAPRISDNYYAVVSPQNINKGWYFTTNGANFDDGWGSWWNYDGVDASGDINGAVMVINAGETLSSFYKRGARVIEGATYKASFQLFVVQSSVEVAIDIIDLDTNTVIATQNMDTEWSPMTTWKEISLEVTIPGTNCGVRNVVVNFRNNRAQITGNDFYVDNMSFEKIADPATSCTVTDDCPQYVNLYDAINVVDRTASVLLWYKNATHSGQPIEYADMVTENGTYYAFYYDVVNDCYSPASAPVTVTIEACDDDADYCVAGCNDNTFINAVDPNTIEYDNVISGFHATIVKESTGVFRVWGQQSKANGVDHNLYATDIIPANGYTYTGDILKATIGSYGAGSNRNEDIIQHQFALLSTDGLYVWGETNTLVSSSIYNSKTFGKITVDGQANGLPVGVAPEDVKMLFGSHGTLGIVTCMGEAYVLSFMGGKKGDGTNDDSDANKWHRVHIGAGEPLNNVVAMRGTSRAMMALTSSGKIYTWGTGVYLGDGTIESNKGYATEMSLPAGLSPMQIGMTQMIYRHNSSSFIYQQSYYVLGADYKLYALGGNGYKQLGNKSNTVNPDPTNPWVETNWVQPIKNFTTNAVLDDIRWISPNEHDGYGAAAINVLTNDKKLYAWGANDGNMIGGPDGPWGFYGPMFMPGDLEADDNIIAVETGGHTTITIKECTNRFGYVGHRVNGSMADGSAANEYENGFNFSDTEVLDVCGALVGPALLDEYKVCSDTLADLNETFIGALPAGISGIDWWMDADATIPVLDPTQVPSGTYYATWSNSTISCVSNVVIAYFQAGDLGYGDCSSIYATPDINQVPEGETATGNVLENDLGEGLEVTGFTYIDSTGNVNTGGQPGELTEIYILDEDDNPVKAGKLTLNDDGTYTFVPEPGFTGEVPITYTIKDEDGNEDSATLSIEVVPNYNSGSNNPPIAQDDTYTVEDGQTATVHILANDSDPDGDTLSVTSVTAIGTGGTAITLTGTAQTVYDAEGFEAGTAYVDASGNIVFVPKAGYVGVVPFDYTISDGNGGTDSATAFVHVIPNNGSNSDIYANDDANVAPKGVTMTGDVSTNDTWGGTDPVITGATATVNGVDYPLTIDGPTTIAGVGIITLNADGTYTFVPEPNFVGTVQVGYTVENTEGDTDTAILYLTSLGENEVYATPDINQVPAGESTSGNVLNNDLGTGLTVKNFTYIDSTGATKTGTVGEATDVFVMVNGTPVKAGTLTLNADGTYTFDSDEDFEGELPITYTAQDSYGNEDSTTLSIEVIPSYVPGSNNPPIAQDDTYTVEEGETATVNVLANDSDPDNDPLAVTEVKAYDASGNPTIVLTGTPQTVYDANGDEAGTAFVDATGNIVFVPKAGYTGEVPFDYTISDGNGGTDTATAFVHVIPNNGSATDIYANDDANVAPKGENMSGNVGTNDTWGGTNPKVINGSVTVNGNDYPLTVGTPEVIPGVGTLTLNADGSYLFEPEPNFVGTVVVSYTVTNDEGDVDTATLYLTSLDKASCVKPGAVGTPTLSKVGITTQGSTPSIEGWPEVVPNGYLVLDAAEKGFVITHMTTVQRDAMTSPVVGMMIYNTDEDCVQIYRGLTPGIDSDRKGWNCLERGCNE